MEQTIHKCFDFTCVKAAKDEKGELTGVIEAIVNAFNIVDLTEERTIPGLFAASLAKKFPRAVWHHDRTQPIAKTLEARELLPGDPLLPEALKELGGLYIKAQFIEDIFDSWQAFLKIAYGLIDEFSIGYRVTKSAWNSETEIRDLLEGEWIEWSPVLKGANQATMLISAKDLESDNAAIPVSGIMLRYFEHEISVLAEVDGKFLRVITEPLGDFEEVISHIVEPAGIRKAQPEKGLTRANHKTSRGDGASIIKQFLEGRHESTFDDHHKTVLDAVAGLLGRHERLAERRLKTASRLSDTHDERLGKLIESLQALREKACPAETKSRRAEFDREYLAIVERQAQITRGAKK